jgi:hypothetical protein
VRALLHFALALTDYFFFFVQNVVLAVERTHTLFHAPLGTLHLLAPPIFLALPLLSGFVRFFLPG